MRPIIYRVSDLLYQIGQACQQYVGWVAVRGEISNLTRARSGHYYFRLKDREGAIDAVMFRGAQEALRFMPENGMEIICWGECTVFAPQGRLQVVIELMERVGQGTMAFAFEQCKARLAAEGLFAKERKRPLPFLPRSIALITSPTGAALRDLLHVLQRRNPTCSIVIASCQVQGAGAAEKIAKMLDAVNRHCKVDLIILGRGGGTVEDLWPFNEEIVARAIAASEIPVLTGIGHETDITIADFVADAYAPTPSAAAEIAVPEERQLRLRLEELEDRLHRGIKRSLQYKAMRIQALQRALRNSQPEWPALRQRLLLAKTQLARAIEHRISDAQSQLQQIQSQLLMHDPGQTIVQSRLRLEGLARLLPELMRRHQRDAAHRFEQLAARLHALSPLQVLQRGYAVVSDREGKILRDASAATVGQTLTLQLAEGQLKVRVLRQKAEQLDLFDDRN